VRVDLAVDAAAQRPAMMIISGRNLDPQLAGREGMRPGARDARRRLA
jgi:hypothetical protein